MEKKHYICIPVIDIDSVLKINKRAYPQAYLEQCRYKLKKRKIVNYIDDEIIDEDSNEDLLRMMKKFMKNVMKYGK